MIKKKRLALLGSGEGTNIQAIIDACKDPLFPATPTLIISNREKSGVLRRAHRECIPSVLLNTHLLSSNEADTRMLDILHTYHIDLVIVAGYLVQIGEKTIQAYNHAVLNIHPADPKKYGGKGMYGLHVHKAVLQSKEKTTYPTVHYVDAIYDHGDVILSRAVPVLVDDTPETLAARVLPIEHIMYPKAIKKVNINTTV